MGLAWVAAYIVNVCRFVGLKEANALVAVEDIVVFHSPVYGCAIACGLGRIC